MKMFRVPRKTKKKLAGKFLLYPEQNGGRQQAFPLANQADYTAYKQGLLSDFLAGTKKERQKRSEEWALRFKQPVEISDEALLKAVNTVFAQAYQADAYNTMLRAKTHPIAIADYHVFVNAWRLIQKGENHGTIACLCIDSAKDNLMRSRPRKGS